MSEERKEPLLTPEQLLSGLHDLKAKLGNLQQYLDNAEKESEEEPEKKVDEIFITTDKAQDVLLITAAIAGQLSAISKYAVGNTMTDVQAQARRVMEVNSRVLRHLEREI